MRLGIFLLGAAFLLVGCYPTRYVPEGKYLLSSNKLDVDNKDISKKEIQGFIRQKPNKRVLGFRFHLGLYNLSNQKKDNRWNRWWREIGEPPSVWDEYQTSRSTDLMTQYLHNRGYYNARVDNTIFFKHREAEITYSIRCGLPYTIGTINYIVEDTALRKYVLPDTINSLVKPGMNFDVDILDKERQRIELLLKNQGYFNFTKEYVVFQADTNVGNYQTNLVLDVKNYVSPAGSGLPFFTSHPRYQVDKISFYSETLGIDQDSTRHRFPDHQVYDSLNFYSSGPFVVKPKTVDQTNFLKHGQLFRQSNADNTYQHLLSLRVFKFIDLQFNETGKRDSATHLNLLDCDVYLYPQVRQSYAIELEGTNSSGNLGIAGNLSYQNKNLFRGAEIFDFKVKGAIETYSKQKLGDFKNTVEFGVESGLKIPKFWLPFHTEQFVKRFNPKTNFNLAYNYQRRPDYTRTIMTASLGYTWQGNKYVTHMVNPAELNAVKIFSISPAFQSQLIGKPYLEYSYQDHFISTSSYTFIFNNQNLRRNNSFVYFRLNMESAGGLLEAYNKLAGSQSFSSGSDSLSTYYRLFGTQYAQYVRSEADFRYNQLLNQTDRLVYRFYAGVGLPYGNSNALPFEKRFFSGGANSIRAWQVRSLGPGSYLDTISAYPNSMADVKLEMNIEYRFKLFWILEGALFADAGNIWAINNYDTRSGAIFKWNKFLNDFAVGTGLGARFDFSFFIFRLDVGMKTRDPAAAQGQRWIPFTRPLVRKDFVFNIGIGYPF